jgi:hypothetical protein
MCLLVCFRKTVTQLLLRYYSFFFFFFFACNLSSRLNFFLVLLVYDEVSISDYLFQALLGLSHMDWDNLKEFINPTILFYFLFFVMNKAAFGYTEFCENLLFIVNIYLSGELGM